MIYSNKRKLILSGWLQENNILAYCTPLRLQKYLFLYESLCKVSNEPYDFDNLKGYKCGPVFSTVWEDYIRNRVEFNKSSLMEYKRHTEQVNIRLAQKAAFIVSSLSDKELSQLVHKYNIWNVKSDRIMAGEQQVELNETDFSQEDYKITHMLENMYPDSLVEDSAIIHIDNKYFVFSKKDIKKLTEQQADTLSALVEEAELQNPIFVTIDESGRLNVD